MEYKVNKEAFNQASAIFEDYLLEIKLKSPPVTGEDIKSLKLLECRKLNHKFEYDLAEFICGEESNSFPYRSSYHLSSFFKRLGLNYEHDGSTRRFWVENVLKELSIEKIEIIIRKGLFDKRDFHEYAKINEADYTEVLDKAKQEFVDFIDRSIEFGKEEDIGSLLSLSVNTELLFKHEPHSSDDQLNELIKEAKSRYMNSSDKQIALEKIWDAFERVKTYFSKNKKDSTSKLVDMISTNLNSEILEIEFRNLTKIGNEYRIRHHETNKTSIDDMRTLDYLFFRMLSLLDLCLNKIAEHDQQNRIVK